MSDRVFESVWGALEDTPGEAENLKLRSSLMIAVKEAVAAWDSPKWRPQGYSG